MSAWTIGLITFACVFGGALAGLYLRTVLAAHHVGDDTILIEEMGRTLDGLIAVSAEPLRKALEVLGR